MAAEVLSAAGVAVHVFDAMPSVGRKFLLAGKGGLNLTHAEPFDRFVTRYGAAQGRVEPWLRDWGPQQVRAGWASTPSSAHRSACSRPGWRPRRCCAPGCSACATRLRAARRCAFTCGIGGWAGPRRRILLKT